MPEANSYPSILPTDQREQKSRSAVRIGLVANIFLSALKISIGAIGHSPALLADGINSTSDVAYYVVVALFMRAAGKPPDKEHPYGHYQLESIGSLVVGSFIITTAIAIFWNSINVLYNMLIGDSTYAGAEPITLWVALFTIALKLLLTIYTYRIGKQTSNAAVVALAYDHRNDIYSAIAVSVGIFMDQLGYLWMDPLAGALVSFVILRTGIILLRDSSYDLMDTVPGDTLNRQIHQLLHDVHEVENIDEIQSHRFGPYIVINITICVDGSIPVEEGDKIATKVEDILMNNIDMVRRVHVHYHPSNVHLSPA